MTRQLEVTIRARNNLMIQERLTHGYKTQTAAAAAMGLGTIAYNALECFRKSPICPRLKCWTKTALRIAEHFGVEPGELWPKALLEIQGTPKLVAYLNANELSQGSARLALPADTETEEHELTAKVNEVLGLLKPRVAYVIRQRLGMGEDGIPHTISQIGDEIGVSKERVRQLYDKGLMDLRGKHLNTMAPLIDWYDEEME